MNPRLERRPTARWRKGLAVAGVVLTVAGLDALNTQAGFIVEGTSRTWQATLVLSAIFWLAYAAFLPPILFVADRCPLDLRRLRTLLIHFSAALAFTYVHILAISYLMAPLRPTQEAFLPLIGRLLRLNFGINFLTYWAIVGGMSAHRYYQESRQRELTASKLEASLAAARLEALRAKLNPHFLFNALNAVSVLALNRQHSAVVDTISRLSELLRVALDDSRPQQIPLAEELRFIDDYLEIIKLCFGDRFVVERHLERESLDALVPSMILQPVVENAVVHGIAALCSDGRITIEARRLNGMLQLRVADNGPGFKSTATRGIGIGLGNTRARLVQAYDASSSLDVSGPAEGGAIVTMTFPFVTTRELAVPA